MTHIDYSISAQRRLWVDWMNAQVDLSLHWAHMSFCWFCHMQAQIRLIGQVWQVWISPKRFFQAIAGCCVKIGCLTTVVLVRVTQRTPWNVWMMMSDILATANLDGQVGEICLLLFFHFSAPHSIPQSRGILQLFYNEWEHYQFTPLYNDISVLCKFNNTVVTIWWVANIKYTSAGSLKLFIGYR